YPGYPGPYAAVAGMHRSVLCLLHPDAALHPYGEDQTRSGEGYWLMKKQLIALMFALLPGFALAAGPSVHLDKANIDLSDTAALQDGARTFVNYCMGCHSAQYQRYERVATDLGTPEELMMENLVFTDALYGEHMKSGMRTEDTNVWVGAAPPDLPMDDRVCGADGL